MEEVIVEEVDAEDVDVEDTVCRGCGTETIPAQPFHRFSPRKEHFDYPMMLMMMVMMMMMINT